MDQCLQRANATDGEPPNAAIIDDTVIERANSLHSPASLQAFKVRDPTMQDLRASQESQETVTRIQSKAEAMYREGMDMQAGESNRLRGSSGISKVLNATTEKVTTQHHTNVGSDGDPSFKDYHDDRSARVARIMEQDQVTVLESALNDGTQKLFMSEHAQGLQLQRGAVTGVEIKNSLSLKNEELVVGSFDLF